MKIDCIKLACKNTKPDPLTEQIGFLGEIDWVISNSRTWV